jgi:hypothetical protein
VRVALLKRDERCNIGHYQQPKRQRSCHASIEFCCSAAILRCVGRCCMGGLCGACGRPEFCATGLRGHLGPLAVAVQKRSEHGGRAPGPESWPARSVRNALQFCICERQRVELAGAGQVHGSRRRATAAPEDVGLRHYVDLSLDAVGQVADAGALLILVDQGCCRDG